MAIVAEHFTPLNLTSIQFAALVAINDSPGLDATRLAALIDYDRPTMTGVIDRLEADHDYLTEGGVFTPDLIETWIAYKRENEILPVQIRPHPYEFALYYDV